MIAERVMEFHEVANLFPLIEGQEFDDLAKDIRDNGLQQPIWTYQGKIIDGRNRYRACVASDVSPRYQEWDGNGSLVAFTISLNVRRRHLTSGQLSVIALDVLPMLEKENAERQIELAGTRPNANLDLPQNFAEGTKGESAQQIAQMLGTNHDYVRAAKRIAQTAPELIEHVKDGTLTIPDAKLIAELPAERRSVIVEKVVERKEEEGKRVSRAVRDAMYEETIQEVHPILNTLTSKSNEWYTPKKYIDAVHMLLGSIDVDPASNPTANKTIRANIYYDFRSNGLDKRWNGKVFLNPPYGREDGGSNQEIWTRRLIEQFHEGFTTEAILLVNASVDTKWFQRLFAYPICFPDHRINFYTEGVNLSGSTHGSAFVYFGPNTDRFFEIFSEFGAVVKRW